MKNIKKEKVFSLDTIKFESNDLHEWYDFTSNKTGKIIITEDFISQFTARSLDSDNLIPRAKRLLALVEGCDGNHNSRTNFTIYVKDGRIIVEIGRELLIIKRSLDYYKEYLNRLEKEGQETYIEFNL